MQSQNRTIRVFPAIPGKWRDVSFEHLRAEGGFLVSARRQSGKTVEVRVLPEAGGTLRLENPFASNGYKLSGLNSSDVTRSGDVIEIRTEKDREFTLRAE